jgi:putative membrane protein
MEFYLFKYLHFVGVFGVVGALAVELILTKKTVSGATLSLLAKVDAIYGVSSILVLIGGFVMWFGVGKPPEFYTSNLLLHIKVGLFAVIGGLSIYPSIFFFKNRRVTDDKVEVPGIILTFIKIEIGLLILIPFLATLVADGRTTIF